jgi:arabinan endo-1,5-alpha-L-arabinosidase
MNLLPRIPLALCLALGATLSAGEPPIRRDLRIHDPSTLVHAEGAWWVFGTGNLLLSARSTDLVRWQKRTPVLPAAPAWAAEVAPGNRKHHYWAPDLIRVGKRWFLYYSVSEFGKNSSAIALASSPVLDPADPAARWTDHGIVLRSRPEDNFNAIDPSLLLTSDDRLWMAFGSFWGGLFLVELDPTSGKQLDPTADPLPIAWSPEIEAPTLYQRGAYTYLFINHGICCRGKDSTYRILVGRSRSVTGPYLDDQGRDLRDGGGRPLLGSEGNFIGPGHASVVHAKGKDFLAFHFYDGAANGAPTLGIRPLFWTEDGWPSVAAP